MRYPLLLFVCCLFAVRISYAQGSLGDPIINVDFGAGNATYGQALGNDALGNPITTYPFYARYPNDGEYTVVNNTGALGHSTWWTTYDHGNAVTGKTDGYMMVVNASAQPDIFYQQTLNNLCPGTTYKFAAWVMNLATNDNHNYPNITFKITDATGNVIANVPTGDITFTGQRSWGEYGVVFTTPANNGQITLTMVNNKAGGSNNPGNDLALDDITFRPYGPVLTPVFQASGNTKLDGCVSGSDQNFTMKVNDANYTNPKYQWEVNKNGTGWAILNGATATTYTATIPANSGALSYQYRAASADGDNNISSPTCRVYSPPLTLNINALPTVSAPPTSSVCEGEPFSLTLNSGQDPNSTYTWTKQGGGYTPTSPNLLIGHAQLSDNGTYMVTVTNAAGCTATALTVLTVYPKVTATVSASTTICEGDNTQLTASGGSKYSWAPATGLDNPNIANPKANPTKTTTYTVTVSNATACSATAQVTVNVTNKPQISAGADQKMTEGQTITLNGSIDANATSYYWTPITGLSDPNALRPTARPTEDITYTLHATSGAPCYFETTADVFIRVYKKVVVPNTFTPNGDGVNDTWNIVALETYPESYTQIFNRLGRVVYQSRGYTKQWDGKMNGSPLPEGTYYYKIDLKPGTVLSGWVAIVR